MPTCWFHGPKHMVLDLAADPRHGSTYYCTASVERKILFFRRKTICCREDFIPYEEANALR